MNLSDFEVDINNKKIHFERNNKLKPINCRIPWTEDHVKEYSRCASDYQYFIERYCRVLTEKGMQIVALRNYQQRILDDFHNNRYNVLLAPRQCVTGDTMIKVRNKHTLEEIEISMEDFYKLQNKLPD